VKIPPVSPPKSSTAADARRGSADSARRRPRREDEVLEAAVRVFSERGYSESTVQDVADELGILKGSLYHYIKTKEDLLFRLFETVHQDVQAILEEVAAEDVPPLRKLELYIQRQVTFNVNNLERISVYYHDMDRLTGDRLEFVLARRREHRRFVVGLIEAAQADGSASKDLDARLAANCVFGVIIWTYRWFQPGRGVSKQRAADACVAFALNGVVGG
jgi:AcrR family transcriptional regulator